MIRKLEKEKVKTDMLYKMDYFCMQDDLCLKYLLQCRFGCEFSFLWQDYLSKGVPFRWVSVEGCGWELTLPAGAPHDGWGLAAGEPGAAAGVLRRR